jgi:hypothetical protein
VRARVHLALHLGTLRAEWDGYPSLRAQAACALPALASVQLLVSLSGPLSSAVCAHSSGQQVIAY